MTRTSSSPPDKGTAALSERRQRDLPGSTDSGSVTVRLRRVVRRTTTRRWASPPAVPGCRSAGTSGARPGRAERRHSRWRDRHMSGDVFATACCCPGTSRLVAASTTALSSIPNRTRARLRRAGPAVRPARSSWADYAPELDLARRGGVFPRTAKAVQLSAEVRAALDIDARRSPRRALRAILRAPGRPAVERRYRTYVKASTETNADVGDKNNDSVRINATSCAAGSLRGRQPRAHPARPIQFALRGGHINTDASTTRPASTARPRVNIKNPARPHRARRRSHRQQRKPCWPSMTDDVARGCSSTRPRPARSTPRSRSRAPCATSTCAT